MIALQFDKTAEATTAKQHKKRGQKNKTYNTENAFDDIVCYHCVCVDANV